MPERRACPGCGQEYGPSGKCCACAYAQAAKRWAERPMPPPTARQLARRRLREVLAQLPPLPPRPPATPAATPQAAPLQPPKKPKKPVEQPKKPKKPQKKPVAHRAEERREYQLLVSGRERFKRRISTTLRLDAESRFLDQRNEAAHRYFLGLVDRVSPPVDDLEEWPEPLPALNSSITARPVPLGKWARPNYAEIAMRTGCIEDYTEPG